MQAVTAEFRLPADHPCLAGHFPGRPIVPGVVLLDRVIALAGALRAPGPVALTHVRFLAPVGPEQTVRLTLTRTTNGTVRFTGHAGETLVMRGELR